jgi:hypothetical protein
MDAYLQGETMIAEFAPKANAKRPKKESWAKEPVEELRTLLFSRKWPYGRTKRRQGDGRGNPDKTGCKICSPGPYRRLENYYDVYQEIAKTR